MLDYMFLPDIDEFLATIVVKSITDARYEFKAYSPHKYCKLSSSLFTLTRKSKNYEEITHSKFSR